MINIIRSPDCGNSPKNKLLEALEISFARGDLEFILASVSEDVQWNILGQGTIRGKAALVEALQLRQAGDNAVIELIIDHVVSHGKAGAVNGFRKHRDGKGYDFCCFYEFANAKGTQVRSMTSYLIPRL